LGQGAAAGVRVADSDIRHERIIGQLLYGGFAAVNIRIARGNRGN